MSRKLYKSLTILLLIGKIKYYDYDEFLAEVYKIDRCSTYESCKYLISIPKKYRRRAWSRIKQTDLYWKDTKKIDRLLNEFNICR